MYCSNCGGEVRDGAKYCSHCGMEVSRPAQDQSAEAPRETSDTKRSKRVLILTVLLCAAVLAAAGALLLPPLFAEPDDSSPALSTPIETESPASEPTPEPTPEPTTEPTAEPVELSSWKIKSQKKLDTNGTLLEIDAYEYDADGRLVRIISHLQGDPLEYYVDYSYDDAAHTMTVTYSDSLIVYNTEEWECDDEMRPIRGIMREPGCPDHTLTCRLNTLGLETEKREYDENGALCYVTRSEYDEHGNLLLYMREDGAGNALLRQEYQIQAVNEHGLAAEATLLDSGSGTCTVIWDYVQVG